jgi:hypothetical protein
MNANSAQFAASNDLDLVHASKNGDVAAFEQLVKRTTADFFESLKPSLVIGKTPKMRSKKRS